MNVKQKKRLRDFYLNPRPWSPTVEVAAAFGISEAVLLDHVNFAADVLSGPDSGCRLVGDEKQISHATAHSWSWMWVGAPVLLANVLGGRLSDVLPDGHALGRPVTIALPAWLDAALRAEMKRSGRAADDVLAHSLEGCARGLGGGEWLNYLEVPAPTALDPTDEEPWKGIE